MSISGAIAWVGHETTDSAFDNYGGYEKVVESYVPKLLASSSGTVRDVVKSQAVRHLRGPFYEDRIVYTEKRVDIEQCVLLDLSTRYKSSGSESDTDRFWVVGEPCHSK